MVIQINIHSFFPVLSLMLLVASLTGTECCESMKSHMQHHDHGEGSRTGILNSFKETMNKVTSGGGSGGSASHSGSSHSHSSPSSTAWSDQNKN